MINLYALGLIVLGTVFNAFGSFSLKKGAKAFNLKLHQLHTQLSNYPLIAGIFLYLLATVCYVIALKMGKLSILYPLSAISYLWVALLSATLLKEKITPHRWFGIFLIIVGIALITYFA